MAGRTVEIARAPDAMTAELWIDVLAEAGIEANSYPMGIAGALGGAQTPWGTPHPLVVAEEDADEARAILAEAEAPAAPEPFGARQDREALQGMIIGGVALAVAMAVIVALLIAFTG
jgi:hypothetical protein